MPAVPGRADRQRRDRGRYQRQRMEQIHPCYPPRPGPPGPLERPHLADRVPAQPPRDVDPAAPLPQIRPGQDRHLLHPGLQPCVDQPRRVHLVGGPTGPGVSGLPRGPYPHLERVSVVCRLRATHGPLLGTPRPGQLRNTRGTLGWVPPTGPAASRRTGGSPLRADLRGQPG